MCIVITGLAFTSLSLWLGFGAQAADWVRHVAGDEAVARLETVAFQAQDALRNQGYRLRENTKSRPIASAPRHLIKIEQGLPVGSSCMVIN